MNFSVVLSEKPYKEVWDGPALFDKGGSLWIGRSHSYPPGHWEKITVTALGQGPMSVGNRQAQYDSMVAQLADQKLGADPATTDIYFEIETSDGQLIQRRGTPTFSGENLDVDDEQWPAGRWKNLTVHPSGWARLGAAEDPDTP
jgi:hypothetical protein